MKPPATPQARNPNQWPSYQLALLDHRLMRSPQMRGVRLQLESTKADLALQAAGIRSTLVVFGSARVSEAGPHAQPRWYNEARTFGRIASERGGARTPIDGIRDNVIATGGGSGIMEAACRGAFDAGAPAIGFNIRLPHRQPPNAYTTPELTFQFHYFAIRKLHLAMRARALIVFPGGFGTLDELFELLTLRQTGRLARIPVILIDETYWRTLINWDFLVQSGMLRARDLKLIQFAIDAEGAWNILARTKGLLPAAATME
jgi:hypothetical protein